MRLPMCGNSKRSRIGAHAPKHTEISAIYVTNKLAQFSRPHSRHLHMRVSECHIRTKLNSLIGLLTK